MSIDNLFFYINLHNGGLCKYTINLVVQSIHVLLFFSTFFCARNLYFVKSFEFYHFFSVSVSCIVDNDNVESSMIFLVMDGTVETIGQI
jgi:hypothetical protein